MWFGSAAKLSLLRVLLDLVVTNNGACCIAVDAFPVPCAAAISSSDGMSKGGMVTATVSMPATVLDGLAAKSGLFIKQRIDWLEIACNWEVPNK